MLKKILALLCLASVASAQSFYEKTQLVSATTAVFPAKAYGACTWDSTHDVGSCVNSAIAAAAVSGGTVMIPCGTYGVSTQIVQQTSNVHLVGCGTGPPRQSADTSKMYSGTRLLWIGSSTANPALVVKTASGGGVITTSADVWGITVDCNNICGKAIQINGVAYSMFNIGGAEATSINIEFTTPTDMSSTGNQHNDIWAYSRSTSAVNSPTGILFDGGATVGPNTSYNTMHNLFAWYTKGDGIVFGDSDNNTVDLLRDFPSTGATGTGVVFANSLYTPPNGVVVKQYGRAVRVLHDGSHGIHIAGSQTGSTFTAAGGNAGTAALAPLTISTNILAAQSTSTLTFASATGALLGETISCGGPVNGVFNGTPVGTVAATTISIAPAEFVNDVPNGTSCTLTYGVQQAATSGTYTLTATAPTVYTLTAPTGGHTQTGISPASGFLTFTDIIIPWTGTATTNDSWTIVIPFPAIRVAVEQVDKDNNLPVPTFELGSYGSWSQSDLGYPIAFATQCVINNANGGGIRGTATGSGSCVMGGVGGAATGTDSISLGGTGNASFGFATTAIGQNSSVGGADSFVGGNSGSDRIRAITNCWGGNDFAVAGDSQTCYMVLNGTGSSTSAIRLTVNSAAANAGDCVNIPNNSAYALNISIVAFDHTTVSKSASWNDIAGLLTRGAGAGTTALSVITAAPPVNFSNGTLTGNAMSLTADTTNGCLNISWTPPSANTDTWNVVARVRTVEVQ